MWSPPPHFLSTAGGLHENHSDTLVEKHIYYNRHLLIYYVFTNTREYLYYYYRDYYIITFCFPIVSIEARTSEIFQL